MNSGVAGDFLEGNDAEFDTLGCLPTGDEVPPEKSRMELIGSWTGMTQILVGGTGHQLLGCDYRSGIEFHSHNLIIWPNTYVAQVSGLPESTTL